MRSLWWRSRYWFWWDLWIGSRAGDCIIHHDRLISVHVEKPKSKIFGKRFGKMCPFSFGTFGTLRHLMQSIARQSRLCLRVRWNNETQYYGETTCGWNMAMIRNQKLCISKTAAIISLVNKKVVVPLSMDFSKAQTPGRGESAIVTTTYAT